MIVNSHKINFKSISSGVTATTITIPLTMTAQIVDNDELIEKVFVETEIERAINPIIDYEKVRFLPLDLQGNQINTITYDIYLLDQQGLYQGVYGSIGFDNNDITFRKESFKQTHLFLGFYDSDNPLTQNLINYVTLFSELKPIDLLPNGNPKPASQISVKFVVDSPFFNPIGFAEGYHIYDYKSGLNINDYKYLYMKATFRNAKTGKIVNLMTKNTPQDIDKLVHELYTRYKLVRNSNGYYYEIDDTYQGNASIIGNNNVSYNSNTCTVTLYEINAT